MELYRLMKRARHLMIAAAIFCGTLALDQNTKAWARHEIRGRPARSIIENHLMFAYYENPGIAFSLGDTLPGRRYIFVGVGLLVLLIVANMVRQLRAKPAWSALAFGLIAGGAVGNMIDRIRFGKVVDFIVMHWEHRYIWPAYNVADAALCVGVVLLLIVMRIDANQAHTQKRNR